MTKVTASSFCEIKTNLIISSLKQNPKPERPFLRKNRMHNNRNLRTQVILRKTSKTNLKRNHSETIFQSGSSSEKQTLSEKLDITVRSRSKENKNQARRKRSSKSINRHTETENNKTLELKVQQLERELSLLKQKSNQGETENTSPPINSITKETKQPQFTLRNRKCTRGIYQQQRPRKNFSMVNGHNDLEQIHNKMKFGTHFYIDLRSYFRKIRIIPVWEIFFITIFYY